MYTQKNHHFLRNSVDLRPFARRSWIVNSACGFGGLAAMALAGRTSNCFGDVQGKTSDRGSQLVPKGCHHFPRAKRIIFLFMQGGVSQVDSFDYKPLLSQHHGESFLFNDARQIAKTGQATQQRLMQSPWKFRRYGETGRWVSQLFPSVAEHIDDLTMLNGMHTEGVAHGPATLFLHCGAANFIRPSFGSWVLYGLGSENDELPGFISIAPSIGNGGPRNYGQAFLPVQFQGTPIGNANSAELKIRDLNRESSSSLSQSQHMEILGKLNRLQLKRRQSTYDASGLRVADSVGDKNTDGFGHGSFATTEQTLGFKDTELDAVLQSQELAWRMQSKGPAWLDLSQETAETNRLYGLDNPITASYGKRCLLARRLCEAGVRFIQVNYGDNSANPAWDQHSNLPKHADHALAVDRPISGLLTDLKRRGLLEDTIVWWGSEFGRTPYAQDNGTGRDHNPVGFTVWLAGGGFQPGLTHGATDDFGFQAVQGKVHMHDLHATLLHQMGLDHRRLTFSHAGRDFRLTDVHGRIVGEIMENHNI